MKSYDLLPDHYRQYFRIPHSLGIYIQGHIYTNTAESFFGLVKGARLRARTKTRRPAEVSRLS